MAKPAFGDAAEFTKAFSAVLRSATEKQLEILQAHFDAPNHTASAQQLATAVGYSKFGPVNSQYAKLARRVAENLGILEKPKEGFWLFVLAAWASSDPGTGDTRFKLRPQAVLALKSLGYKKRAGVQQQVPADGLASRAAG